MPSPLLRILVLGAHGGLGRALVRQLAPLGPVTGWTRAELDLSRLEDIAPRLEAQPFDVLVNPAGLTSPDACETQPELARRLNTEAPAEVAAVCERLGRRFIHFSTDYVFDGSEAPPRSEEAPTAPVNVYGRTKLDGELAVLAACPRALVARVSWLFGPDKPSHPDQVIAKALQSDALSAIADKSSAPTYTHDLCDWIATILAEHPGLHGTIHLCNRGSASWQAWGESALNIAANLGLPVKTTTLAATRLADATFFQAARPPHTAMSTEKLTRLTGITPRSWDEALDDYLRAKTALAFSSAPS